MKVHINKKKATGIIGCFLFIYVSAILQQRCLCFSENGEKKIRVDIIRRGDSFFKS